MAVTGTPDQSLQIEGTAVQPFQFENVTREKAPGIVLYKALGEITSFQFSYNTFSGLLPLFPEKKEFGSRTINIWSMTICFK